MAEEEVATFMAVGGAGEEEEEDGVVVLGLLGEEGLLLVALVPLPSPSDPTVLLSAASSIHTHTYIGR